jgi:hypothetical protein
MNVAKLDASVFAAQQALSKRVRANLVTGTKSAHLSLGRYKDTGAAGSVSVKWRQTIDTPMYPQYVPVDRVEGLTFPVIRGLCINL